MAARMEIEGLSKRFGATRALEGVDMRLMAGGVHALVGENGAGKSTLIKILAGVHRADSGVMRMSGEPFAPATPAESQARGINLIPQEVRVVPALDVAENVCLGDWPGRRRFGLVPEIDRRALRDEAVAILRALHVELDPARPAGSLGVAERQILVIARALRRRAQVLILDEPTASLESEEVGHLFTLIRRLKRQGVAVVYVSHRLEEVAALADRVSVLRDGALVREYEAGAFTIPDLVRDMTGREVREPDHVDARADAPIALAARVVLPGGEAELAVPRGTVSGLAGLLGCGASDLLRRLFGAAGPQDVELAGERHRIVNPADAVARGIGFVPGERRLGVVASLTIWETLLLPHLERPDTRLGPAHAKALASRLMDLFDIRPRDPTLRVGSLSGGNQQKVLFARWFVGEVHALLLDEPTHGIDVGAKANIHTIIQDFVAKGGTALAHSSETGELLALCDAVLMLREGRLHGTVRRGEPGFQEHKIREVLGG